MARILGLLPAALVASKQGATATQFYQTLRDLGIAPRKAEAFALFKYATGITHSAGDEPFRPLGAVPAAHEMTPWPTRTATGVSQRVQLIYRDRATGSILHTYYTATSPNGITREQAVQNAIDKYSLNNEEYETDLIGAVHVGAYQQVAFRAA